MKVKGMIRIALIVIGIALLAFGIFKIAPIHRGDEKRIDARPADNKTTNDAIIRPGEFHGNELDGKIDCVLDNVDLLKFITYSREGCRISRRLAIGAEVEFSLYESRKEKSPHFSLNILSASKRKILDEVIRHNPGYYWAERDGVINIQPREFANNASTISPLDKTIPAFEIHKIPADSALEYLVRLAIEQDIPVTTFGREIAIEKGVPIPDSGKIKNPEYYSPEELINVSIPHEVTIRACLNAIVMANPPAYWWATKYGEKTALELSSFKTYNYAGVQVPKNLQSTPLKPWAGQESR